MAKFIEIKNDEGNPILVNFDHVLTVTPPDPENEDDKTCSLEFESQSDIETLTSYADIKAML